ncbi:MAG: diphthamide synthesis protein, partial [Nanoarchaeota archaeon]
ANPLTNDLTKIKQEEIDSYAKEKKGKVLSFLSAKKVGILVSVKPHQGNLKRALEFQEKLKGKKESFIFLCDNLDPGQFENFTDIEIWVNTACPRIEHKKIINLQDALDLI